MDGVTVRQGTPEDLAAVARIQAACPEAAQWDPAAYLAHDFAVALCEDQVAGFAVARTVAQGESEILNLAVAPAFRRRGIGRRLVDKIRLQHPGVLYLEVRESNLPARKFYETEGFRGEMRRLAYYQDPRESAIVMKFYSC